MFDTQITSKDNIDYTILITYKFPDKHKFQKNQRITLCRVFMKPSNIVEGEAYKFIRLIESKACVNKEAGDTFDKVMGRKVSLHNALQLLKEDLPIFSQENRTIIWNAFLKKYQPEVLDN